MRLVCVTGTHPSDVELVAGLVRRLDAPAREADGATGDPHGALGRLNRAVLDAFGGGVHDPPPLEPGWERAPELDDLRREAAALAASLPATGPVVWADTALALTLPFWTTVVPISQTVVVVRSPDETVHLLAAEAGLDPERATSLWLRYVTAATTSASEHCLVPYPHLRDAPGRAIAVLGVALGHRDPEIAPELLALAAERVEARPEVRPPAGPYGLLAGAVYGLIERMEPPVYLPLMHALDRAWTASHQLEALKLAGDELQEERDQLATELKRVTEQERSLTASRALLLGELADLQREIDSVLATAQDSAARQVTELAVRDEELTAAIARQQQAHDRLADAERANERLHDDLQRLRGRRGVRVVLALARVARPVFRLVRRVRRGTVSAPAPALEPDLAETAAAAQEVPEELPPAPAWDPTPASLAFLREVGPVTVVVPVFNAAEELRRCLDALRRNTTWPVRLLVIDDASTDPAVATVLGTIEGDSDVTILRNPTNLGFTATVNRGFAACDTDVVVLNSDTEVTPRWLENLVLAAYQDPSIGTVTPLSDNAGAFSVPDAGAANVYPGHLDRDAVGRLVTRESLRAYPETPTGNGFCLYVKRRLLDEIGPFDSEAFPQGYGEENDFCMRALKAGWRHVVDDATLVFHVRNASFGARREQLLAEGRARVDERHPEYTQLVHRFLRSDEIEDVRRNVAEVFARSSGDDPPVRPRVLHVWHEGTGGTPQTAADLVHGLDGAYEGYALVSDTQTLRLLRLDGTGTTQEVEALRLEEPLRFGELTRADYRAFVAGVLTRYAIELVHVRHLIKHTFDLPDVAAALGIPLVLSLHDYYLSCPTIQLLDEQDRFCGGRCTPGQGTCRIPMDWISDDAPHLKHGWVHVWRSQVRPLLVGADALVTTSPTARDVYLASYPDLDQLRFEVIEHGRDLEQRTVPGTVPAPDAPIRILVPGNIDVHKGAEFIAALTQVDAAGRLEFHFLGNVRQKYRHLGTCHGTYERDEFAALVREIRPAFVGLFSIWAETYSHTLSEAWSVGMPVLATDVGALGERVRAYGGGWLLDHTDPEAAYRRILEIAADVDGYLEVRSQATVSHLRTRAEMAADYDSLYRSVLEGRRSLG